MQTAELAVVHEFDHEPDSIGGSSMFLKCNKIIALVRKILDGYLKRNHKFGKKIPMTVEQALALDTKNGNTFWQML